jgi:hypothetical protein
MRVKVYADFEEALDPVIEVQSDKKIELVIDYCIPQFLKPIPEDTIRIFATIEPDGRYIDLINHNQSCFNYLITNEPVLLHLPQARLMVGFPAFVPVDPSEDKIFGVSAIFSGRNSFPGHPLRHELWRRREEIRMPKFFYVGERTRMPGVDYSKELTITAKKTDKAIAMQTMFHIAIDCFEKDNMFTEKLIDPLISKVIPIYWGAGNVNKYFEEYGIYQVHNVNEIINICKSLTENDYWRSIKAIRKNFKLAQQYSDYGKCLQRKIQEIINEMS